MRPSGLAPTTRVERSVRLSMSIPATIVVVPRERFALTRRSLDSIYENTSCPFKLVYVDGGSPAATRRYLEAQAKQRGFALLRRDYYLTPNEARNLGFAQVETPYTVFVDNDVLVTPGWLEALIACADDTKAWVVGPLYCMGELETPIVHMAGGRAYIDEQQGVRRFYEVQRFWGVPLSQVRPRLHREACEVVEFHCMLVRTEVVQRLGPFDEQLMSALENPDFCMSVRAAGGEVYLEPAALVTYLHPPPCAWRDLPYFFLRWSEQWNRASLRRFREKWNLPDNDPSLVAQFHAWTGWRRQVLPPSVSTLRRIFGWRFGNLINRGLEAIEAALNRWLVRDRRRAVRGPRTTLVREGARHD